MGMYCCVTMFVTLVLDCFWFDVFEAVLQEWESSTQFSEALRIGKTEASAALNLMRHVPPDVVSQLGMFVRTFQLMAFF